MSASAPTSRALGNLAELDLPHPPRRVVSLVPSVTESLFDLQCGDCVVGVTDYCLYPAEKVALIPNRVGGTKNPDIQRIKAAQPDLVIANKEENRKDDVEALEAAGYKVWVTFPCSVAETFELLWATLRVFDAPHMTPVVDMLERAFEWASRAADENPPVSVFCPIWREPKAPEAPGWWMTANRATYMHDVLRVCGGANIFADRDRRYPLAADLGEAPADPAMAERDTRYPHVTPAEVAARAPDVILLPSEPFLFTEADVSAFEAFPDIPAVKNKRIHLIDGSLLTWPGTRLGKALAELPAVIGSNTN